MPASRLLPEPPRCAPISRPRRQAPPGNPGSPYGGAAPLISSKAILATAAAIALTEGQHAGVFRYLVYEAALRSRSSTTSLKEKGPEKFNQVRQVK